MKRIVTGRSATAPRGPVISIAFRRAFDIFAAAVALSIPALRLSPLRAVRRDNRCTRVPAPVPTQRLRDRMQFRFFVVSIYIHRPIDPDDSGFSTTSAPPAAILVFPYYQTLWHFNHPIIFRGKKASCRFT